MEYVRGIAVALLLHVFPNNPRFIALPVTLFFGVTLVVLLLTLSNRHFCFYQMTLPVERGTDAGLTFLRECLIDFGEFFFV